MQSAATDLTVEEMMTGRSFTNELKVSQEGFEASSSAGGEHIPEWIRYYLETIIRSFSNNGFADEFHNFDETIRSKINSLGDEWFDKNIKNLSQVPRDQIQFLTMLIESRIDKLTQLIEEIDKSLTNLVDSLKEPKIAERDVLEGERKFALKVLSRLQGNSN